MGSTVEYLYMICKHYQNGECTIASALAKEPVRPDANSCKYCSTCDLPQQRNNLTLGIARNQVKNTNPELAARLLIEQKAFVIKIRKTSAHCNLDDPAYFHTRKTTVILNYCHHKHQNTCRLATQLINLTVPVTDIDCEDCIRTRKPRQLNEVTCKLALQHVQSERKKDQLINILIDMKRVVINQPGTALKNILHKIGISESANCECEEYATQMDKWGTQGCIQRKQNIVDHLNAQQVSWFDMLKVAAAGYLTTESLVNHAIALSKDPSCTQNEPSSSP